jgi:hypothetical protein
METNNKSMSGETNTDEKKTTPRVNGWHVEYAEGSWHVTYYGTNGPDVSFYSIPDNASDLILRSIS